MEKNEITQAAPANIVAKNVYTSSGHSIQIGNVSGDYVNNITITQDMLDKAVDQHLSKISTASHAIEWTEMDRSHFCLFVIESENYTSGSFSIPYDCSLEEKCTIEDLRSVYKILGDEEILMVKKMPCIFAKRNSDYKKTDEFQQFYVGKITEICKQRNNIKISYVIFNTESELLQNVLNENAKEFRILENSLRNELDMEHWAIKNLDLIKAMHDIGYRIN